MGNFMRKLRGDLFTAKRVGTETNRLRGAVGKGKRELILAGVISMTFVATAVSRFAPRIGEVITKGKDRLFGEKEQKVGRGTSVPEQERGSVQDGVTRAERKAAQEGKKGNIQETEPVKKSSVQGLNDKVTKTGGQANKKGSHVEGESLRLMGQVIEECKDKNKKGSSLPITYELIESELHVKLEGKILRVSEKGIYSMVGNPYYIKNKMSKSEGITRLISDFTERNLKLLSNMVYVYERDIHEVEGLDKDLEGLNNGEQGEKDVV